MELALVLRELWGRKRALLIGLLVSCFVTFYALNSFDSLLPPKWHSRALVYSAGHAVALVDWPTSAIGDGVENVEPLAQRATVYANLLASPAEVDVIGRYAGIPGDQIFAAGPLDDNLQRVQVEPTAQKRNVQITGEAMPYRIDFTNDVNLPTVDIWTQAPTSAQAVALASAAVKALRTYVSDIEAQQHMQRTYMVTVKEMGAPSVAVVNAGITKKLGGLVFVASFIGWCVLVLIAARVRAYWRASALLARDGTPTGRRRARGRSHVDAEAAPADADAISAGDERAEYARP